MATNHTVTDLTTETLMNPILTIDSFDTTTVEKNSDLIQNILKKFQLQKSDYVFLKNILCILETEHMQMIN